MPLTRHKSLEMVRHPIVSVHYGVRGWSILSRDAGFYELDLASPTDVSNVLAAHCPEGYILSAMSHAWRACLIRDGITITPDDSVCFE